MATTGKISERRYILRGMDERSVTWFCCPLGQYTTSLVMWRTFLLLVILIGIIVDAATYHLFFQKLEEVDRKVNWALWCFKPTNWTGLFTLLYLVLMIYLHGAFNRERKFATLRTPLVTYYLFNITGVFIWVNMLFYFLKIRLPEVYEPALEYTLITCCISLTSEWLLVNHFVTCDVIFYVFLTFSCVMFYIIVASSWYDINFYSQLNFIDNYDEARRNLGFLFAVTCVVLLVWYVVLYVKSFWRARNDGQIEETPLVRPVHETTPSYAQVNKEIVDSA